VLDYGLDDQMFKFQQGLVIFLFATTSRLALGPTQPRIQWEPGALFQGVKQQDMKPTTPQYAFMAWCSIKVKGAKTEM
jgi:hypothetical protein